MNLSTAIKRGVTAGAAISATIIAVAAFGLINRTADAGASVSGPVDCDSNAVIRCGVLSTDAIKTKYAQNSTGDLDKIYSSFGISSTDITNLDKKVSVGVVKADGTVWIDGKLIGVNAHSSGRNRTTNSQNIPNATAYRRPPSDSFARASTSIKVFIGYKGNTPSFGIISSCGNPLSWDKPNLDVQKTVSKDGKTWKENETFKHGETATFRVQVKETSNKVDINNVNFADYPQTSGTVIVPGSARVNGSPVDLVFGQGIALGTLKKGSTTTITYKVKVSLAGKECGTKNIPNVAHATGHLVKDDTDGASVNVSKTCTAQYSCKSLTHDVVAKPKPGDTYTFKITEGTIKYTKIKSYKFIVNGKVVQNDGRKTLEYKVPSHGWYMVEGRVVTEAGESKTSEACKTKFDVSKPDPKPVACKSLTGPAELYVNQKGTYKVSATDSAGVKSYTFKVNGQTVSSNGDTMMFTPTAAGEHTVSVTVTPKDGYKIQGSATCEKKVTVKTKVVTVCKSLSASKHEVVAGNTITFTAEANAQGTTVKEYIFTVNGKEVQRSSSNKLNYKTTAAGTYKVKVSVKFANGDVKSGTNCEKTVKAKVVTVCEKLTAGKYGLRTNEKTTLTAYANAQGTTVKEYIFTVNGKEVQRSANNKYEFGSTTPGTYKVVVTAVFANGEKKTSNNCAKEIEVTQEIITKCKKITGPVSLKEGEKGTYTAVAIATGTEATKYTFTVDGQKVQEGKSNEYKYTATPGTHKIKVSVMFADGNTKTSTNCETTVEVEEIPETPVPEIEAYTLCQVVDGVAKFTLRARKVSGEVEVTFSPKNGTILPDGSPVEVTGVYKDNRGETKQVTVTTQAKEDCTPEEKEIEVCRDGKVIPIKENERLETDTDAPCPEEEKIEVCRDGEVVIIKENERKDTDTSVPCPEEEKKIEVCRDGVIITIHESEKQDGDTEGCVEGKITELPNTGLDGSTMAGALTSLTGAGALFHRKRTIRRQK